MSENTRPLAPNLKSNAKFVAKSNVKLNVELNVESIDQSNFKLHQMFNIKLSVLLGWVYDYAVS